MGTSTERMREKRERDKLKEEERLARLLSRTIKLDLFKATDYALIRTMARLGIETLQQRSYHELSGGQQQRALLARALCATQRLLLLDEPVSGVDHNGQALFLDTVNALRAQQHMAILMVSHDWTLVREYADMAALIDKTTLAVGTPDEVFSSEAYAAAFPHTHGMGRAH